MEQTKTIASDKLLVYQLQNLNWDQFWLRLMARCFWVLRNRYNLKWPNDDLTDFSRNVISEVIYKIFIEKERKWNTERYPDFEEFVIGTIDSHINNTLKKKHKESTVGENELILDKNIESVPSQVEKIATGELRKQLFDELQRAGADDDEMMIFECLADGIDKPDDIRNELGITESHFHNVWRRLNRKRKIIQKKLAAYGY
ncbi:MAG: hypothetical protein IH597_08860 [Bacteroidales bacterium]|nr:hypothetical protein [Bacteroidales bacterium]